MIRRALILDTETTGLDPAKDKVIEIGAVLYSVENRCALVSFSTLFDGVSNDAEAINRIPVAAMNEVADLAVTPQAILASMRLAADVIVCHNAEFDQQWFVKSKDWSTLPWLCTMADFAWPSSSRETGSLIYLALEHGIGISSAHRALTDCNLIAALFDRMPLYGKDLQAMFAHAMRPKAIFQGLQVFDDNQKAKDAGFRWDGATKKWTRRMAIEDAAALPFKTLKLRDL
jgi:DNA polymerase-3 subunit epsilon